MKRNSEHKQRFAKWASSPFVSERCGGTPLLIVRRHNLACTLYKILIQIYVLQQKLHVVFTRSISLSPARQLHHHRYLFLERVAGCMCMRVICQKNLARLLDCVGALKHEAEWRDAIRTKHNIVQHITTMQTTIFHLPTFNEEVDDMYSYWCIWPSCVLCTVFKMFWMKRIKLRNNVDVENCEDVCSLHVSSRVLGAILNKSWAERVNVYHKFSLISILF